MTVPAVNLPFVKLPKLTLEECIETSVFSFQAAFQGKSTSLFNEYYLKLFGTLSCIVPNITLSLLLKSKKQMKLRYLLLIILITTFGWVNAQTEQQYLTKIILLKDSLFWTGYNNCDIGQMKQFVADDIEFYHDKGGVTLGIKDLIASLQNNICGNDKNKIRREAVQETVKAFLLKDSDSVYGAILTGEHLFYVTEKDKKERLDGSAKFTHLWILKDNEWKMSRILSYDHGPAPYINKRIAIKVNDNSLIHFVGQYITTHAETLKVQSGNGLLNLIIGDQKFVLYPESATSFFVKDRDLTFEFIKNEKGKISKMIVREHGEIVDEAINEK